MSEQESLILVDASAILFRSYYAMVPMTGPKGEPTGALFGFAKAILKLLREHKPEAIAIAFDGKKSKEHRKKIYSEYKANRKKVDEALIWQIEMAKVCCDALGITKIIDEEQEADDLIATYAVWASSIGKKVLICSQDKDLMQLLDESISMLYIPKNYVQYNAEDVVEKYGILPKQMTDWLALVGDSSDNIPGVTGIGPKTATLLLERWGDLQHLFHHIEEIEGAKKKEQLIKEKEIALMSYQLVKLNEHLPRHYDWSALQFNYFYNTSWLSFCQEHGLKSIAQASKGFLKEENKSFPSQVQGDLFSVHKPLSSQLNEKTLAEIFQGESQSVDIEQLIRNISQKLSQESLTQLFIIDLPTEENRFHIGWQKKQMSLDEFASSKKSDYSVYSLPEKESALLLKEILQWVDFGYKVDIVVFDAKKMFLDFLSLFDEEKVNALFVSPDIKIHDLGLGGYLLFPHIQRSYDFLTILSEFSIEYPQLYDQFSDRYRAEKKDTSLIFESIIWLYFSFLHIEKSLKQQTLWTLYNELELPLVFVLAKMQHRGIFCDKAVLESHAIEIRSRIALLESDIYSQCKKTFNLNSPKQLSEVLYGDLELKPPKKTKTGLSTDASSLEFLLDKHTVISPILEYRFLEKLRSTYYDALASHINIKTQRIHPVLDQKVTATGRLSCHNPNLQNIPIRNREGRLIRQAFSPQNKEYCFLSADYSQIELRLLAHMSEDPALLEAFTNGEDIHRYTASLVFGVPSQEVTSEQRSYAKAVNFGIVYGQQAFGLAKQLKISMKEAKEFIEAYFQRYSTVKSYLLSLENQATQLGYAQTLLGRKRVLPELQSPRAQVRALGQRLAINTPIQGSAADIIKLAMIAVEKRLLRTSSSAKMILQIHDELLFEVHRDQVKEVSSLICEEMESVMNLRIPLKVNVKIGNNWYAC